MKTCNIIQNIYLHDITWLVVLILNFTTEIGLWIFPWFEWRFNLLWKIKLLIITLVNVLCFLYSSLQSSRDFRESSVLLTIYFLWKFQIRTNIGGFAIFSFSHSLLHYSDSPEPVGFPLLKNWWLLLLSESNLSKQKVRAYWFPQFFRSSQQQHI